MYKLSIEINDRMSSFFIISLHMYIDQQVLAESITNPTIFPMILKWRSR